MNALFLSDIHGSLPALESALSLYDRWHCEWLFLLGDLLNYGPRNGLPTGLDPQGVARSLNTYATHILAVRGNCDSEVDQMLLNFPIMSDSALVCLDGHRFFLTHGHLHPETYLTSLDVDAVITGHTHRYRLSQTAGPLLCNGGSPTFPKDGNPPTLLHYHDGIFSVCTLDGTPLISHTL